MKLKEIIFATSNNGKLVEVRLVAEKFGIKIVSPREQWERKHLIIPALDEPPDVEEVYDTYFENARAKAEALARWSGMPAIGDDSGLEVKALSGAPGVFTARYAGPRASSSENIEKLLRALDGVEERSASFRSVLVLVGIGAEPMVAEGLLEGEIGTAIRGKGGFGYDPVFIPCGSDLTLAEIKAAGSEIKTHRIKAFEKLFQSLTNVG